MKDSTTTISDDLLRQAKAGNPDALSHLWSACEPLIAEGARRHPTPSAPTLSAADVAQEAARLFLEAVRGEECDSVASLNRFLASKLPYRLQSFVRAERRRLGRQVIPNDLAIERVLAHGRPNAYSGAPPGRRVARALERLSPRQRAVIAGLYFHEDSLQEIADELGMSYAAVSAVHVRALKFLRKALSESEARMDADRDPTEE